MTDLIVAQAERLALLTDAHKARKSRRKVSHLNDRLRAVTARIAAMEGSENG